MAFKKRVYESRKKIIIYSSGIGIITLVSLFLYLSIIPGVTVSGFKDYYCAGTCEIPFTICTYKYNLEFKVNPFYFDEGAVLEKIVDQNGETFVMFGKTLPMGSCWNLTAIVKKDPMATVKYGFTVGDANIDPYLISKIDTIDSFDTDNLDGTRMLILGKINKDYIIKQKSLMKDFKVVYLEKDDRWNVTVNDFNMTWVNLTVLSKDSLVDVKVNYPNKTISFKVPSGNYHLDLSKMNINLLEFNNISFGTASTTIILQIADIENLEDSYINEILPNNNYGTNNIIYISNDSSSAKRGIIKFNISIVPTDAVLMTVGLHFAGNTNTGTFRIWHMLNQTWDENSITWNNQPCMKDINDSNNCNLTSKSGSMQIDINIAAVSGLNGFLKEDLVAGNKNCSFILNSSSGSTFSFLSKESFTSSDRPYLNITYVPLETNPPIYSRIMDNSSGSLSEGFSIGVSSYWNDTQGNLGYATLRTNKTGSFINESIYAFSTNPQYSNFTISSVGYSGNTICWVIWANDSLGNLNASMGSNCFNVGPPYLNYGTNSTNSSVSGQDTLFSLLWSSSYALSGYIFSFYNGSNWTDGTCSSYSNQNQCQSFGCSWTPGESGGNWISSQANLQQDSYCYYYYCEYALFDLSGISGNTSSDISEAYIRAYVTQVGTDPNTVVVWEIENTAWAEGATCATLNAYTLNTTGKRINTNVCGTLNAWCDINITETLKTALDGGHSKLSVRIHGQDDTTCGTLLGTSYAWRSASSTCSTTSCAKYWNDRTSATYYPRLNVTFVSSSETCSGTPNYEFKNDSWVSMTGTANWSNVTKWVNATVGSIIKWGFYANNTGGLWNFTGIFQYTTQASGGDTCTCPGSGNNWAVSMDDNCVLSATCNLGAGNLSFTGTGNFYVNALLNCYSMGNLASGQTVWMQSGGFINRTK